VLLVNQAVAQPVSTGSGLGTFERYLSVWVALCMVAGVLTGKLVPTTIAGLRGIEFGEKVRLMRRLRC
jgi:ACR3 family arsenite transporter